MDEKGSNPQNEEPLKATLEAESKRFQACYGWLQEQMPALFYEEVASDYLILLAHTLMDFHLQGYFVNLQLEQVGLVMCLDSTDADLRILRQYTEYGIRNYQAYLSKSVPPVIGATAPLRIGTVYFAEGGGSDLPPVAVEKEQLQALLKQRNPSIDKEEFDQLLSALDGRFLRLLSTERLVLALDMFFRAKTRDPCQYEVRYNEDWEERSSVSMQIVLAWRNTPKRQFLYRMARVIQRHSLVMQRVNATYVQPFSKEGILVMALGLHGKRGEAAWDAANILDFLREIATLKYFDSFDEIDKKLVTPGYVSGNTGNLLRAAIVFIHQALLQVDPHLYTKEQVIEGLYRHPELTQLLCDCFKLKFDPWHHHHESYLEQRQQFIKSVEKIDTGHEEHDMRRKNILLQGMNFIHHTLKTNFFRMNMTALAFRLDPAYLDEIPIARTKLFPELPYAIFFVKGLHFFAFHIRFKDLSRGGVRSIYPEQQERMLAEIGKVFSECYNLAYTQHKKNKDIPEGGAKAVIFLTPDGDLEAEALLLRRELQNGQQSEEEIEACVAHFVQEQKTELLHHAQRSFIEALLSIVNCDEKGRLKAKYIIDFCHRPEYIYLGPDENMHDSMIEWIAAYSKYHGYKPGGTFISGKPEVGINHKAYGVTSLGVHVYVEQLLRYLGIDPKRESFTVKISGGPDGDVAGNQICQFHRHFPNTTKLLALTDVSGTIYDPEGLNLEQLVELFHQGKPISYYPPDKLHDGGFLVERLAVRMKTRFEQQILYWKKEAGQLVEEWQSSNDMIYLWRHNLHKVTCDLFIPAGGRPKTLHGGNVKDFLDEKGEPTARAIVEGANLYLDNQARKFLEKRSVLIIKDSSANKTGVICSSFEVLSGLALDEATFIQRKEQLVAEILERLQLCAAKEGKLLLESHAATGELLTDLSEEISGHINGFTDQLLEYLEGITLPRDIDSPLIRCFLDYCLPTLRNEFADRLLSEIPDSHKKAIIATHLAAELVYERGLSWSPSIADILPIILQRYQKPTIGWSGHYGSY